MILKGFGEFINESESNVTYQDLKLLLELGISEDITDDVYKLIDQGRMTHREIIDWVEPICDKYKIENWTIGRDGLVNVDGDVDVDFENLGLTKLPLRFGKVTGQFDCSKNNLTTLKGSPIAVGLGFWCGWNNLTDLVGGPRIVNGDFGCSGNPLTTLKGAPIRVDGDFYCRDTDQLTTFDYLTTQLRGKFYN